MGKTKMKMERLETAQARQAKFSKRKVGFVKKANELATLCDVDVALVAISPTNKPTVFVGQDKDLSVVVERLSNTSFEEREERRAYTLNVLKKSYPDSEVDTRNVSEDRSNALKLHQDQQQELEEKIDQKSKILRDWQNPQDIEDLSKIKLMQKHLTASLNRIRNNKFQLGEVQQNVPGALEVTEQQQN